VKLPVRKTSSTQRIAAGLQFCHAVQQPTNLSIQVGSGQTPNDRGVRGPLQQTSLQRVNLRIKNAPEGKVRVIPLRGAPQWLYERITTNERAHRSSV
jgi:hypothetical protein